VTTPKAFRDGIVAAVATAGGVTAKAVCWSEQGRPAANPVVVLSLTADVSETFDPRSCRTPSGDDYAVALSTSRVATVQIRTETTNKTALADAHALSDSLELGLSLQAVTTLLQAAGLVLVGTHAHTDLSYMSGDCLTYARTFDAQFRYEYGRADPTVLGTIEHVQVSGELDLAPANTITISVEQINKPEP
jgi:hypothetical protein